mmetsp:Transcript_58602/g.164390  ORF Transcript_58602/g.164390 Transcript_58602/m.164390 type:complete len:201 (+) Transcript_58602:402-1004(+)
MATSRTGGSSSMLLVRSRGCSSAPLADACAASASASSSSRTVSSVRCHKSDTAAWSASPVRRAPALATSKAAEEISLVPWSTASQFTSSVALFSARETTSTASVPHVAVFVEASCCCGCGWSCRCHWGRPASPSSGHAASRALWHTFSSPMSLFDVSNVGCSSRPARWPRAARPCSRGGASAPRLWLLWWLLLRLSLSPR